MTTNRAPKVTTYRALSLGAGVQSSVLALLLSRQDTALGDLDYPQPNCAIFADTGWEPGYVVDHCLSRGCEIMAHGVSASRMITSRMSGKEEQGYIRQSIHALRGATGSVPRGWFGPEYGESFRTPQLLAEAGIRYVCDWVNDEQPYSMITPGAQLVALPIMYSLDDVYVLWDRRVPIDRYPRMLTEAFDTMYREGERIRRLLVLNLHPWLIGQPFRARYLGEALGHIMRRQRVWAATGSEIADWYLSNPLMEKAGN